MTLKELLFKTNEKVSCELERILEYTDPDFVPLFDSMRYSVSNGGKRIRPFLVLEFCKMLGGDERAALPFACAIELVHCYSLIHDDLPCMDNDDLRRGKPTNHKVFGEATALLAGDALLTYALEVAGSNPYVTKEQALEAVLLLTKAAGARGMIGGQQLDLIGEETRYDLDTLVKMNRLKTGELIRAACVLGVIAANGGTSDINAAEEYADGIGRTFQIVDDILDVTSDAETLGKNVNADAACGKTTYMTYMTPGDAHEYASVLTENAIKAISSYPNSEVLCELSRYLLDRNN